MTCCQLLTAHLSGDTDTLIKSPKWDAVAKQKERGRKHDTWQESKRQSTASCYVRKRENIRNGRALLAAASATPSPGSSYVEGGSSLGVGARGRD